MKQEEEMKMDGLVEPFFLLPRSKLVGGDEVRNDDK